MTDSAPVIDSPCVDICVYDAKNDFCSGCYRRLDEIKTWMELSPRARCVIMSELDGRRRAAEAVSQT